MELKLQQFVDSMTVLSDIRNMDILNPVLFLMEQPVTATQFVTATAIREPSYMGVPINMSWVCLDPLSVYYRRVLKLKAWTLPAAGTAYNGQLPLPGLNQAWIEVMTFAEIFADPQYYDNGSGGGIPGIQGIQGPPGPAGPTGPAAIVDYAYIISEVLRLQALNVPTLTITGASTVTESSTAQFTVSLVNGTSITPILSPVTISTGAGFATINASNLLTAGAVTADQQVVLNASYVYNGTTITATKTITVTNSVLASLTLTGIPAISYAASTHNAVATAVYANGSTAGVTSLATYVVAPSTAGTVSATGLFTAGAVTADTLTTITATYVEAGITMTAVASTTVRQVLPISVAVTGAATVAEGANAQMTATVAFNNGSFAAAVAPTWSVVPSTLGSVSATGLFSAGLVTVDSVAAINVSVTVAGTTVTGTKNITVTNVAAVVYPYYGVAAAPAQALKNGAFILGLANRGPVGSRLMNPCAMDAGTATSGLSMFYAYPVSYGQAIFTDLSNGFQGGMDGASGNNGMTLGPITVNVTVAGVVTPFYLYQSDMPGIGAVSWSIT